MSEVVSDDEIVANENVKPNAQVVPGSGKPQIVSPTKLANAGGVPHKSPMNVSAIEEDIVVDMPATNSVLAKEEPKDEIDEEVDYDDDFEEEALSDEEEYKPKIVTTSKGPTPEPAQPASRQNLVTIPAVRAQSPQINSGRDPSAMADIRKAMENEKMKAEMSKATVQNVSDGGKKGFLADYESTMPRFNLQDGANPVTKAALQRLRDLKKMERGPISRFTVEKVELFSQRPQTEHSMFLANKSLKYCNSKTVSCQTGEDDVEIGTMTDDIWTDDKEMQFPTLTMGQSGKAGDEAAQMLPFLRRTLPLFEASLAENRNRQMPMAAQLDAAAAAADAQRVRLNSAFGLPDSFVRRCIGADVTVADVSVCHEWYGADHTLILYTWPWQQRPPAENGSVLDSFTRPMQSLVALYPISISGGTILQPARCLYSFCRLSSLVVVSGKSHIIIAGSEMGSLLAWDLRDKPRPPTEHSSKQNSESSPPDLSDPDLAPFQGALWLPPAFSTDSFAFSSSQETERPDADISEEAEAKKNGAKAIGIGIHSVEICCVRSSDGTGSDPLIFALDLMGVVSFWRVLEFATQEGSQVKLALQGTISLPSSTHSLGSFIDARSLCVHPQQQMQFVVVGTSGVHQAHRHQRVASVSDGPSTFELLGNFDDEDQSLQLPTEDAAAAAAAIPPPPALSALAQPCSAAFNPFFPGLLLVAYAEGDLALFDCTMCVPTTHWSGAVSKAPNLHVSVAWSPCRPCVFFVKSLDTLDIWDLAVAAHAPVESVDIPSQPGASSGPNIPLGAGISSELYVTDKGHPVVAHNGQTVALTLSASLTTPLQAAPEKYSKDENSIDTLLVSGRESMAVFPTLERHSRKMEVPQNYVVERDVMRRIVGVFHPLQAWIA